MAVFKVATKNQDDVGKKPRVYFTCHPDDFDKYFKKICDDIFKTHDCAIYYTEDMTQAISEDEKEVDLGRNNLFIVPVTLKLLSKPNRAMDDDIPYAKKAHIPILPFMMEPGIDVIYARKDKFGELQYLKPESNDTTEISYEEKLKKYLESVLISDEMAKRVRAAFDAYIFLSYRKKDRKYANDLMRLIHSNPECRDIAIWFDEFLTPGESFKENIERMLDDCDLFTLLVTPRLLEKVINEKGEECDNYVISTELPMARTKKEEKGTDIFAVEMEKTDKNALSDIDINDYLKSDDTEFRARLIDTISRIATSANNTPEHNFLIGLAYLDGIDVEVNREFAIELITSAAEADLVEAIDKLYDIYSSDDVDYKKALIWAQRKYDLLCNSLGEEHPDTLSALNNLAITYSYLDEYKKALEINEKVYTILCQILGEEHPETLNSLHNLASTYGNLGEHKKALEMNEKVYTVRSRILGEEHPDTLMSLSWLAYIYNQLGEYKKALEMKKKVYTISHQSLGEEHQTTLNSLNNLAATYYNLGEYQKALEIFEKVYTLRCRILGEEHPDTLTSLNNLAETYRQIGEHNKALEINEKVCTISLRTLGEEHPDTLTSLNNLALTYGELGEHKKSLEIKEKVYTLSCRILGEEHHLTLTYLNNLAYTYNAFGEHKIALELLEKAYTIRCCILGEEHPDTLMSLNHLASIYSNIGEYDRALELSKKAYELYCKVCGEEHPHSVLLLKNYAISSLDKGKIITGIKLLLKHRSLKKKIKKRQ